MHVENFAIFTLVLIASIYEICFHQNSFHERKEHVRTFTAIVRVDTSCMCRSDLTHVSSFDTRKEKPFCDEREGKIGKSGKENFKMCFKLDCEIERNRRHAVPCFGGCHSVLEDVCFCLFFTWHSIALNEKLSFEWRKRCPFTHLLPLNFVDYFSSRSTALRYRWPEQWNILRNKINRENTELFLSFGN